MTDTDGQARSAIAICRIRNAILLAVLTALVLFLEMPQWAGWLRKPSVLTLALPGIVLIYLGTRPPRRELFLSALWAAVLFSISASACRNAFEFLLTGAGCLGIASLLGLGIGAIGRPGQPGTQRSFAAAAMLCFFSAVVPFFFLVTVNLSPRTYDAYLCAFDRSLGSPSFAMGRLFSHWAPLKAASVAAYLLLPFVMAAFYALQQTKPARSPLNIMVGFTVAAAVGWILYIVYPAAGPVYAFPEAFPMNAPPLPALRGGLLSLPGSAARNCMPSLHTAWALLVCWNSRPFGRWVKTLAASFLALTLAATLGLGEHYLVDLVVAVPFALCIQAACAPPLEPRQRERLWAIAIGAGLTAAWIAALDREAFVFGIAPAVSWALIAGTVGVCAFFETRLARRLYWPRASVTD